MWTMTGEVVRIGSEGSSMLLAGNVPFDLYPSHAGGPDVFDLTIIVLSVLVFLAMSLAVGILLGRLAGRRSAERAPTLIMEFQVGTREIHAVRITYSQSGEWVKVSVDGSELISKSFATGLKLTRTIEWQVGSPETHRVQLEKTRQRFLPQTHPQHFVARVDGRTVATGESTLGE
jgi:hypothetical protein